MDFRAQDDTTRWTQNPDLRGSALLVLAGILFFSDFLFTSKNFYFRDILSFHYPLRKVLIDSYARGEFPLWNPFVYLGQPMLANPNYMAFYPSNILHAFLPFNYAFKLHFILHPLLAGVGIYFLQRRLRIQPMAALGGSLIYQFSGTLLSFLNFYNIVPAVALIPWIGWAFLGALAAERWWRRSLLFGLLLGLQVIAFEPLMVQCNLLLLAGLALYHFFESQDRFRAAVTIARAALVGGLFALVIAAIQVLPTLELLPRTARGNYDFDMVSRWSLHPADLINVLVPNLFGDPYTIDNGNYWGEAFHDGKQGYLVSFFVGGGALLLACFSFFSSRKTLLRILAGLSLLSVILAFGKFIPVYQWLYEHLALFRLGRYPSKYFLLTTLAFAIMASLGLEVLSTPLEGAGRRKWRLIAVAFLGVGAAVVLLGAWSYWNVRPLALESWIRAAVKDPALASAKDFADIRAQVMTAVRSSGAFLLLSGGIVLAFLLWRRSIALIGLLILLLAAELIPANIRLSPLISEADMDFVPEVNAYLIEKLPREPYRVAPPTWIGAVPNFRIRVPNRSAAWLTLFNRRSGQPLSGIINGIQYSLYPSVDDLNTRESEELLAAYLSLPYTLALTLWQKLNSPVLLALGEIQDPRVRFLESFDTESNTKLNAYWLEKTLPRAYFVSGVEVVPSHVNALHRLVSADFPAESTVILEDPSIASQSAEKTDAGMARIVDYRGHRVLCEVESKVPGYLVLLDSYFPGWRAYRDGNEVEILRANYAFRAVPVEPGRHQVEFRYAPSSFYTGLSATCAALLLALVSLFWKRRN